MIWTSEYCEPPDHKRAHARLILTIVPWGSCDKRFLTSASMLLMVGRNLRMSSVVSSTVRSDWSRFELMSNSLVMPRSSLKVSAHTQNVVQRCFKSISIDFFTPKRNRN